MEQIMEELRRRIGALLAEKEQVIIAIDGNCTAGKTTLTAALAREYDCNVFRMDDFFLRPQQRTAERFAEPGGNVDYERFREEVLEPLKRGGAFSYRPFDCSVMDLSEPVAVEPKKLNIVEGTYSRHPVFGDCYDLRIFLTVSEELQAQRVRQRPAFLHRRFFEEWIPMERLYFSTFSIRETSHLVLDPTGDKMM